MATKEMQIPSNQGTEISSLPDGEFKINASVFDVVEHPKAGGLRV